MPQGSIQAPSKPWELTDRNAVRSRILPVLFVFLQRCMLFVSRPPKQHKTRFEEALYLWGLNRGFMSSCKRRNQINDVHVEVFEAFLLSQLQVHRMSMQTNRQSVSKAVSLISALWYWQGGIHESTPASETRIVRDRPALQVTATWIRAMYMTNQQPVGGDLCAAILARCERAISKLVSTGLNRLIR